MPYILYWLWIIVRVCVFGFHYLCGWCCVIIGLWFELSAKYTVHSVVCTWANTNLIEFGSPSILLSLHRIKYGKQNPDNTEAFVPFKWLLTFNSNELWIISLLLNFYCLLRFSSLNFSSCLSFLLFLSLSPSYFLFLLSFSPFLSLFLSRPNSSFRRPPFHRFYRNLHYFRRNAITKYQLGFTNKEISNRIET